MKEKGVDPRGVKVEGERYIRRELITINGYCYYFDKESKLCRIHPHNPMVCYTYPLVVRLDDDCFYFKLCLREQQRRNELITDELRKKVRALYKMEYDL